MNETMHFRMSQATERAFSLLAAIGFTALVGLAALEPAMTESGRRVLPTDANQQRAPGAPVPAASPVTPQPRGDLDPSLRQIDHGGAHHG